MSSDVSRPLVTRYVKSESREESTISLVYDRSDTAGEAFKCLSSLMGFVEKLGLYGGFAENNCKITDSRISLTSIEETSCYQVFRFHHSFASAYFLEVCGNLVRYYHLINPIIKLLEFQTLLIEENGQNKKELSKLNRTFPFELHFEIISNKVTINVEFLNRARMESMQIARDIFEAWYQVALARGFAEKKLDQLETKSAVYVENELQITSVGMQIVYDRVSTSEESFFVLCNFLSYVHHQVAEIYSVDVS